MHVMIDLETLGTRPDAVIIQVGAVAFEATGRGRVYNETPFNRHVLVQDGCGTVDHGTLCFWLQEASAGRMGKALSEHAVPLQQVLQELTEFPGRVREGATWADVEGVWSKPSSFDLPILASAYARFGAEPPWEHWKTRCARTLFSLTGGTPDVDQTGMVKHDAFDDALVEAMQVQAAMGGGRR